MPDNSDPFYFPTTDEPILPIEEGRFCSYGKHWLPATSEHFAVSRRHNGQFRFAAYCRACMSAYRTQRYHRLHDAGLLGKGRIRRN